MAVIDPPLAVIEIPAFPTHLMLSSGPVLVGELKEQGSVVASYC